ncbi:MAG: hypothetical protein IPM83_11760 [Ignavibacteria bacterium]|nr:hypothetical protein [Ignavibacteria bacterium]
MSANTIPVSAYKPPKTTAVKPPPSNTAAFNNTFNPVENTPPPTDNDSYAFDNSGVENQEVHIGLGDGQEVSCRSGNVVGVECEQSMGDRKVEEYESEHHSDRDVCLQHTDADGSCCEVCPKEQCQVTTDIKD